MRQPLKAWAVGDYQDSQPGQPADFVSSPVAADKPSRGLVPTTDCTLSGPPADPPVDWVYSETYRKMSITLSWVLQKDEYNTELSLTESLTESWV